VTLHRIIPERSGQPDPDDPWFGLAEDVTDELLVAIDEQLVLGRPLHEVLLAFGVEDLVTVEELDDGMVSVVVDVGRLVARVFEEGS
jgi:hypothetical protein